MTHFERFDQQVSVPEQLAPRTFAMWFGQTWREVNLGWAHPEIAASHPEAPRGSPSRGAGALWWPGPRRIMPISCIICPGVRSVKTEGVTLVPVGRFSPLDLCPSDSRAGRRVRLVTIVYNPSDEDVHDLDRRRSLFEGNLFVYGPRPSTTAVCDASRWIEQMLGDEPVWAQQRMTEIEFATLFQKGGRALPLHRARPGRRHGDRFWL